MQTPAAHGARTTWSDWSPEAFARAQAEDRIILINVVASWCHWCHVMDEETYADPEVAALLGEHFVTLRVDSDARPDVAERYRAWGWPATAVLTPSAQPVLALRGYQEPEAFAALLRELVADQRAGTLRRKTRATPGRVVDADADSLRTAAVAQLDGYYEPGMGGWGQQQKYPFDAPLEHALWRERLHGETIWSTRAQTTLWGMAELVDPVWGGMYQYSLRGDWSHPHYEKITAIQAGALVSFAVAARVRGDERWLQPAMAVRGYMNAFMRDADGGYFTSQDADLRPASGESIAGIDYYGRDDEGRRRLGLPRVDANVYADLNGLMVRGLVELAIASGDPEVLADATATARRVLTTHRDGAGLVKHAEDDARDGLRFLRDQAATVWGLMALHRATGDTRWLTEAKAVADAMLGALHDERDGGFFAHTPDPAAAGVLAERRKPVEENALAARALLRLHRALDGDGSVPTPYRAAAERALLAVGTSVPGEGRIVGTYVLALEELTMPTVDITVVGVPGDPSADALFAAAVRYPELRATVERSPPGERYPDIGGAAVYLCTHSACSAPIKDAGAFAAKADAVLTSVLPARTARVLSP